MYCSKKFRKSGWNSGKCQKYYKLFDSLAVDAYVTRRETQPDVASEQQWDFPDIWWNSDHLQPIQFSHFRSKQTGKNRKTEVEDISLCSLHIKNCMDMTQSNQPGRTRIRSHTVWRDEGIGPQSPSTLCFQHLLYPQAVRAPEDEWVPQATPLDVLNCEVWWGETRRGKV